MQHRHQDLSRYRLKRAQEDLETAKLNYENGMYKAAVNRTYYAIFHAIRAVNILDGFDASKPVSYTHLADDSKEALFAWDGYAKVAPAQEK